LHAIGRRTGSEYPGPAMEQLSEQTGTAQFDDDNALVEHARALIPHPHPEAGVETEIKPSRGWVSLDLKSVWRYHELLFFLIWRDVKVRYKQTVVGMLWVVLQPVTTMIVFTLIFGRLAKLPTNGVPYPLFVFSGLLPWQLFTGGLLAAGTSIVGNSGLITKVYFPRLIIPIAAVISGIVDFLVSLCVLIALMVYYGTPWRWQFLALPAFVALTILVAFSVGLWLSMLNVRYRDVQYTIPYVTQLWLFMTPIAYASALIPDKYRLLISLNPMTSVVNGFRWALLGSSGSFGTGFFVSIAVVIAIGTSGIVFFKRVEKTFADLI
jgi:lipopolysaccharide transport system permease protein